MSVRSEERKQAAREILEASGHFTPEQCEAIAEAIAVTISLFAQQVAENLQERRSRF